MVFDKQIFLNYRGYGVSEDSEGKRLPTIHFFLYKGPGPLPAPGLDQVCGIHMNLDGGCILRWSSIAPWLVQLLRALKHTALSSKGLECQSWLKSAPISQRGRHDVLNSSWPHTCEGRCSCQAFRVYQEGRVLILQIFDNVFTASVIPSLFQNAIWEMHRSSSVYLSSNGSIDQRHRSPFLSADHTTRQPRGEPKGSQDSCHGSAGQGEDAEHHGIGPKAR